MPLDRWPWIPILGFFVLISAIYLSVLMPATWFIPLIVFVALAALMHKWKAMPFVAMAVLFMAFALANEFWHWSWLGMGAFFWYAVFYTFAVLTMGLRFLRNYWGKDRYMVTRTFFNMGVQLLIGFALPYLLPFQWGGGAPDVQGKGVFMMYVWPLEHSALIVGRIEGLTPVVKWFLVWNIVAGLVVMPILVYYFGRRPYCSWFCGCGCLAETLGDPFRRITPRSRLSRKLEPVIYPFLVAATLLTLAWLVLPKEWFPGIGKADHWYLMIVKFGFSTMLGVGLYSLMGGRIWCRYFCPWVALFGVLAKHGRYAIRTRGELCMGCGMCNTYCEMGIDIRGAAMEGRPVKTTTCVGCGMCIQKCPRRVLSFAIE